MQGIPIRVIHLRISAQELLLACFFSEISTGLVTVLFSLEKWDQVNPRPDLFPGQFTGKGFSQISISIYILCFLPPPSFIATFIVQRHQKDIYLIIRISHRDIFAFANESLNPNTSQVKEYSRITNKSKSVKTYFFSRIP